MKLGCIWLIVPRSAGAPGWRLTLRVHRQATEPCLGRSGHLPRSHVIPTSLYTCRFQVDSRRGIVGGKIPTSLHKPHREWDSQNRFGNHKRGKLSLAHPSPALQFFSTDCQSRVVTERALPNRLWGLDALACLRVCSIKAPSVSGFARLIRSSSMPEGPRSIRWIDEGGQPWPA